MAKTLYDILQVSRRADQEVITAAYDRLCTKADADSTDAGRVQRLALRQAYDVLSNPERRSEYDRKLPFAATPPSPPRYQSDGATAFMDWWRSPRMFGFMLVAALLIGTGLLLNHTRDAKVVKTVVNTAQDITKIEAKRADTESVLVNRAMDNQATSIGIFQQTLDRSVELAHIEQQRRHDATQAGIAATQARIELQRQQQDVGRRQVEFAQQQRLNEERRVQQDYDDHVARRQVERERAELCQMERQRYGRAISC